METIQSLTRMAENMRRLRKIRHLTQEDLADRTGLHPYSIGLIERKVKAPSLRSVEKIARALNVSVAELVGKSTMDNVRVREAGEKEIARILKPLNEKEIDALLSVLKTMVETFSREARTKRKPR